MINHILLHLVGVLSSRFIVVRPTVCRHEQWAVWHNTADTVILLLYVYVILSRDGLNIAETCGWGLTGDSLEHTSAEVFGTAFRRFCATFKKSFYLGKFIVAEMICCISFWLLTGDVSRTDWLWNYLFNVSRFWQLNYFSKFANTLGLYAVTLIKHFAHSIRCLSHDISTASSTASSHRMRSSASSFNL